MSEVDELKAHIELLRRAIIDAKNNGEQLDSGAWIYSIEETIGKYAKDIATEFFYYWYNSHGTNTEQGFDEWWEINRDRLTPCKYKEQSDG